MTRAFLAIDLPDEVRAGLRGSIHDIRDRLDGWRWTPIAGTHLTLRFLGEVESDALVRALPAWADAIRAVPPFDFRIAGLGAFPAGGRARALWAGVDEVRPAGALAALAGVVEAATRGLGFEADDRPFRPHVTLARARRGERASRPPAGLALDAGRVVARQVTLFESTLTPRGARYTVLERFPLDPGRRTA